MMLKLYLEYGTIMWVLVQAPTVYKLPAALQQASCTIPIRATIKSIDLIRTLLQPYIEPHVDPFILTVAHMIPLRRSCSSGPNSFCTPKVPYKRGFFRAQNPLLCRF